jgi:hypothetical protein
VEDKQLMLMRFGEPKASPRSEILSINVHLELPRAIFKKVTAAKNIRGVARASQQRRIWRGHMLELDGPQEKTR